MQGVPSSHLLQASHVERAVLRNAILGQIALNQGSSRHPGAAPRKITRAAEYCNKSAKICLVLVFATLAESMSSLLHLLLQYTAMHTGKHAHIGEW
jgi:hypothetical protein